MDTLHTSSVRCNLSWLSSPEGCLDTQSAALFDTRDVDHSEIVSEDIFLQLTESRVWNVF